MTENEFFELLTKPVFDKIEENDIDSMSRDTISDKVIPETELLTSVQKPVLQETILMISHDSMSNPEYIDKDRPDSEPDVENVAENAEKNENKNFEKIFSEKRNSKLSRGDLLKRGHPVLNYAEKENDFILLTLDEDEANCYPLREEQAEEDVIDSVNIESTDQKLISFDDVDIVLGKQENLLENECKLKNEFEVFGVFDPWKKNFEVDSHDFGNENESSLKPRIIGQLECGGKEVTMLIDSGSTCTLLAETCLTGMDFEMRETHRKPISITGQRLHISGEAFLWLGLKKHQTRLTVLISKENFVGFDGILGLDAMTALKVKLDAKKRELLVGREKVPLVASLFYDEEEEKEDRPTASELCRKPVALFGTGRNEVSLEKVTSHLNFDLSKKLQALLKSHERSFSVDEWDIGNYTGEKFQLKLTTDEPVRTKPYRIPEALRKPAEECIEKMIQSGVIRESNSPFCSPVVLVQQKGKMRFCIDSRRLNSITVRENYPLKYLAETFDQLQGNSFFGCLDVRKCYWAFHIEEDSIPKTAFSFAGKHYECLRVSFGLKNAPAFCQRIMDKIVKGIKGCLSYIDDIIIFAKTEDDFLHILEKVLTTIGNNGLKLNLDKSFFLKPSLKFLGHIVSAEGLSPDPDNIAAVRDYPRPTTLKAIRAFIGMAGFYRKFVKDFSEIASPITSLTKKRNGNIPDVKTSWNQDAEDAFHEIKSLLISPPLLRYPDYSKTFWLSTDASIRGISAVLSQEFDGLEHPIQFASRLLKPAETRYSIIELECLAIKFGINHFKPYLWGQKFILYTDNRALTYIHRMRSENSKLARYYLALQEYDFEVKHRRSKENAVADALSRYLPDQNQETLTISDSNSDAQIVPELDLTAIRDAQRDDPELKLLLETISCSGPTEKYFVAAPGVLCQQKLRQSGGHEQKLNQVLIPPNLRLAMMRLFHDTPFGGGHLSTEKTLRRMEETVYWRGMGTDVDVYCQSCVRCKRAKEPNNKHKAPLQPIPPAESPFERLCIDIVGPLPLTLEGYKYVLVISDFLTKWTVTCPLKTLSAEETAKNFVEKVIFIYGRPMAILSDRGSQFTSKLFAEMCRIIGIRRMMTSSFHPQGNGQVERTNKTICSMIRAMSSDRSPGRWIDYLAPCTFFYNCAISSSTRASPFLLLFGRPPLGIHDLRPVTPLYTDEPSFDRTLHLLLTESHKIAKEEISKAQKVQSVARERREKAVDFEIGDQVYLRREIFPTGIPKKFFDRYFGPFIIEKSLGPANFEVRELEGTKILRVHADRLKPTRRRLFKWEIEEERDERPPEPVLTSPNNSQFPSGPMTRSKGPVTDHDWVLQKPIERSVRREQKKITPEPEESEIFRTPEPISPLKRILRFNRTRRDPDSS